ncbi:hypothetical protein ID866_7974, partial [Astraeus odoratus]
NPFSTCQTSSAVRRWRNCWTVSPAR